MKKILIFMLALVLGLMLMVSCGKEAADETTATTQPSNQGSSASTADSTTDSSEDNTTSTSAGGTTDTSKKDDTTDTSKNGDTTDTSKKDDTTDTSKGGNTDTNGTTDSSNKDEDVVEKKAPTVEGELGSSLGIFNSANTFGDEGKISGFTNYTYEYDLSKYSGKTINIKSGGQYRFYGKSVNTQIFISPTSKGRVCILLDNADITYVGSGPVIFAEKCESVIIATAPGSVNKLTDNSKNGENGVIKVKSCDLTMDGKGKLILVANAKNGISNTKNLTINGGEYDITAVGHGIYGQLGLTINGGKFKIDCDKSGFKVGDTDAGEEVEGNVVITSGSIYAECGTNGINANGSVRIDNGRFNFVCGTKGIDAKTNIDIKGGIFTFDAGEDAIKSKTDVSISGNTSLKITTKGNGVEGDNITVSTAGVIYIKTSPVYVVDPSGEYKRIDGEYILLDGTEKDSVTRYKLVECKGFEANVLLSINNAIIGIDSFEDGMNADNIKIEGGKIAIATLKDGMDASESITVNGTAKITICSSDKGLKATKNVELKSGTTLIIAMTDAIKADKVNVAGGKHILHEKVEYVTEFKISGGTFVSVATTKEPVIASSTIPNVYGAVANLNLCTKDEIIVLMISDGKNQAQEKIVLYKDYTDKMSVFYATEQMGSGTIEIVDQGVTEDLITGKFY